MTPRRVRAVVPPIAVVLSASVLFASVLSASLLAGCATPGRRPTQPPGRDVDIADSRIVALAGALEATARDRRSLVGTAHVSLSAKDLRFSRSQRVALQLPAKLRVEILGLFNQVAAILTTNGVRYQLYEPGEAGIREGVVGAHLLWEVARMDLLPEEAVSVLLGAPWQPEARLEAARELSDGTLLLAYRQPRGTGRRIFEFVPPAYLTRVRQRGPDDRLVWEAAYDDYRDLGERAFAHEIAIRFPRVDAKADFRFKVAELNRDLPASAFELEAAQ